VQGVGNLTQLCFGIRLGSADILQQNLDGTDLVRQRLPVLLFQFFKHAQKPWSGRLTTIDSSRVPSFVVKVNPLILRQPPLTPVKSQVMAMCNQRLFDYVGVMVGTRISLMINASTWNV
jgi:hypothetical protein